MLSSTFVKLSIWKITSLIPAQIKTRSVDVNVLLERARCVAICVLTGIIDVSLCTTEIGMP